jgi:hypothetical protein
MFKPVRREQTFFLAIVWGLCGENCPKSAKVWKISQNVENSDSMISVT